MKIDVIQWGCQGMIWNLQPHRKILLVTPCLSAHLSFYPSMSIHLFVCLSVCPFIFLSVYPSICWSISPSIYLSIHLSVYPFICLSICLSVYLSIHSSICPSICMAVHPSTCWSICPSIHLSVYPSVSIHLSIYPSIHLSLNPCVCPSFYQQCLVHTNFPIVCLGPIHHAQNQYTSFNLTMHWHRFQGYTFEYVGEF